MNIVFEALQTMDRLGLGDKLIAAAVGTAICLAGPLVHEIGHLLPARLLCRSGRIALFPFHALGGFRAWVVIFAIELPDEQLRRISAGKTAAILVGGPLADLVFVCCCALAWRWFPESIGAGIVGGGAARVAVWLLNVFPIPVLNNDAARFVQLMLTGSASRSAPRPESA